MSRRAVLGLLAATSCGPERITSLPEGEELPPVFGQTCGVEGPHQLLPLAEGEHAYRIHRLGDGDRLLVSTFFVDPQIPLAELPPTIDRAIYAVGPCGEDPVTLARGLTLTSGHDGMLLACDADGRVAHALDPDGGQPPRPLLTGWCPMRSTAAGLLTVEAEPEQRHGTLVLLDDPADPQAQPQVLATGIRTSRNTYFGPGGNATTSLWAAGSEAIGLDDAGVVHHFDLTTAEATAELFGVAEVRVSADGRFMVWQALEPAGGEPDAPVGPVFLRDREAQTDAPLLATHLEWTGNPFAGDYLVIRDDEQGPQVFAREGPEPIELPPGTDYRGLLDAQRLWLARRVDGITEELLWTPGEAEPVVFARHEGQVLRREDGLEIFETDDVAATSEGSLSFVPWSGDEPVRLADRVHASRGRLADGRILTMVQGDATDHGPLRLIDPETGAWVQVHPRGYVQSPRLNQGDPLDGDVAYAVDDPEARGVYRAAVLR